LACTAEPTLPTPAFTEDEVTELIRYWEAEKYDAITDPTCLQDLTTYKYHSQDKSNILDSFASNPDVRIEHKFKSNGIWLVNVTSLWEKAESHGGGEFKRACLYRLDDSTGEVNPGGKD
jgi:hypothetical protein